jgi:hypothetical protein
VAIVANEQEVLTLAHDLWIVREVIDVDIVDGAFYWHICRGDLRKQLLDLITEDKDRDHRELLEAGVPDHLKRIFDHLYAMNVEIPGLSNWISYAEPPRMRDSLILWDNKSLPVDYPIIFRSGKTHEELRQDAHTCISIGIRNSRWRGIDVETALRDHLRRFAESSEKGIHYLERLQERSEQQANTGFGIAFSFFGKNALRLEAEWIHKPTGEDRHFSVESPVIVCTTPYPLAPEGLIAAAYDHIVVTSRRWHEHLYGHGEKSRQEPETAIRTWAIGLLQGMGKRRIDAEAATFDRLGLVGRIAEPQYNKDRQNLIGRVPEAKPYVFGRPRKHTLEVE